MEYVNVEVRSGSGTVPKLVEFKKDFHVVEDYPFGSMTTEARYEVVKKGNKESIQRTTINPKNGRVNKPKRLTYAIRALIGLDDRGYVFPVMFTGTHISIMSGNMQHSIASVFPDDKDWDYLIKQFK